MSDIGDLVAVVLVIALGVSLIVAYAVSHTVKDAHRERIAAELVARSLGCLKAGGDRIRIGAALAHIAEEKGCLHEANELWARALADIDGKKVSS